MREIDLLAAVTAAKNKGNMLVLAAAEPLVLAVPQQLEHTVEKAEYRELAAIIQLEIYSRKAANVLGCATRNLNHAC